MNRRSYPFSLEYVQKASRGLAPVFAPRENNRYHLALGITSRCNFDCPICYYHAPDGKDSGQDMSPDFLDSMLAALPRLANIIFGLEGEPLLHPAFISMLELAGRHAGMLTIITNGSLLNSGICAAIDRQPAIQVLLSIDAADAALYKDLRKGGNFARFQANASQLAQIAPCLLHATVFRQNLSSLLALPDLAASLGIGGISLQQLRAHPGSQARGIQAATPEETGLWLPLILQKAGKKNISVILDRFFGGTRLQKKLNQLKEQYPFLIMPEYQTGQCVHANMLAGIRADGQLFPCAGDFQPSPLVEHTFDSIFNHPYLTSLRALHGAGIKCGACHICMKEQD